MITASGILFQSKSGRVLFLKRGADGDHPGEWCFPGGKQEEGETLADCAIRETLEETGYKVDVLPAPFTRRISMPGLVDAGLGAPVSTNQLTPAGEDGVNTGVDFTTYRVLTDAEFTPMLGDGEHTAYAWAAPSDPPQPLHPGAATVIARIDANELVVARMVAAGDLVSPTKFENITIYAMRMSGTGVSYRAGINEFVWRNPAIWVSQDMVDRCAGVPLIFQHPDRNVLNSKEFVQRVVGTIMFGYIKADELWCVARVYDDEVIKLLEEEQMSTSPAVVFREQDTNFKMKLEDGTPLLVEGVPTLLDHLAICQKGVWDKGGDAEGILQHSVADAQPVVQLTAAVAPRTAPRKPLDLSVLSVKSSALEIKMRSMASRFRVH